MNAPLTAGDSRVNSDQTPVRVQLTLRTWVALVSCMVLCISTAVSMWYTVVGDIRSMQIENAAIRARQDKTEVILSDALRQQQQSTLELTKSVAEIRGMLATYLTKITAHQ
jgi:hypothetical protein